MIIANPIYDSVFKYLLEDIEIAQELLSTIMSEDIVSISVQPQETIAEVESHMLTIFRLDFKAVIKTKDGTYKKVLIELQKAKKLFDIMRFRRYLAENYQKLDTIPNDKDKKNTEEEDINVPLPIVTIYFLGFNLKKGYPAVFKTSPQVSDVVTGEIITKPPKEDFVDLLTHNSYTIQIPSLTDKLQTRIEKVLMIFSPKYKTNDRHKLDYLGSVDDPLISKILNRLIRAASDEQMRKNMDVEDEVENTIANLLREKDEKLEAKDKQLAEKELLIEEERKKNVEKELLIEEERKKNVENELLIEEERKRNVENELLIEEERKRNVEKDEKLAEKDKQNEELLRIIQEMKEQRNNK